MNLLDGAEGPRCSFIATDNTNMKSDLGTVGTWIGMLILAALFGGLVLAIYPGWAQIGCWLSSRDAPSWIQAVGSIAAIAAAAAIASHQSRQTQKEEADRHKRRMDALSGVFTRARALVYEIVENCDQPNNAHYYLSEHYSSAQVQDILTELQKIDVSSLGSANAVEAMLELRASLRSAENLASSLSKFNWDDYERQDWDEYLSYSRKIVERARTSSEVLLVSSL